MKRQKQAAPRLTARVVAVPSIAPIDAYWDVLLMLAERAERAERDDTLAAAA